MGETGKRQGCVAEIKYISSLNHPLISRTAWLQTGAPPWDPVTISQQPSQQRNMASSSHIKGSTLGGKGPRTLSDLRLHLAAGEHPCPLSPSTAGAERVSPPHHHPHLTPRQECHWLAGAQEAGGCAHPMGQSRPSQLFSGLLLPSSARMCCWGVMS